MIDLHLIFNVQFTSSQLITYSVSELFNCAIDVISATKTIFLSVELFEMSRLAALLFAQSHL